MSDFIKRDEFSSEMRSLREDINTTIREGHASTAKALDSLTTALSRTEEGWRERTHRLNDELNMIRLTQAVQNKQIEALESHPHLDAIRQITEDGFQGVNKRLDIVNGRLNKHEGQIGGLEALNNVQPKGLTRKTKALAVSAGGVGVAAVLHSLFEMIKAVGPAILSLFKHA